MFLYHYCMLRIKQCSDNQKCTKQVCFSVQVINNWHRANDERGLMDEERSYYSMLNYIMDELMPWHNVVYDLSLLEVNQ